MQVKERPIALQPLVMRLKPVLELDEDTFFHIAQLNKDLRIELNAEGDLIVMPPTGGNHRKPQFQTQSQAERVG